MEILMCVMMYCTDISDKWYDIPYENITINKDMSGFVGDEYIIRGRTENKKLIRCGIK